MKLLRPALARPDIRDRVRLRPRTSSGLRRGAGRAWLETQTGYTCTEATEPQARFFRSVDDL